MILHVCHVLIIIRFSEYDTSLQDSSQKSKFFISGASYSAQEAPLTQPFIMRFWSLPRSNHVTWGKNNFLQYFCSQFTPSFLKLTLTHSQDIYTDFSSFPDHTSQWKKGMEHMWVSMGLKEGVSARSFSKNLWTRLWLFSLF